MRFLAALIALALSVTASDAWTHGVGNPPPAQAVAAGFLTPTFNSTFAPAKFNSSGSNVSGNEWYLFNFFGTTPSNSGLVLNGDGSLTIAGLGGIGGQIATAADLGSGNFVGTAFGGGAYFEAVLKFDNTIVNTANGWPAFWSMAIEHLANQSAQQWTGQAAGYSHFIEPDFFEYDLNNGNGISYGGTIHDWYGIFSVTCNPGGGTYCDQAIVPPNRPGIIGMNWNVYHKLGFLWVPATSSTSGSLTWWLDDIQQGSAQTYAQFTTQSPPPGGAATWTYGVIDQQHISVMLGTGVNQFLTIQSVRVWQASSAGNLVH